METYRFGILGVGPVGAIMAAHLAKAGHNVTLIDVLKAHMDEIKKNGLTITGVKEMKVPFSSKTRPVHYYYPNYSDSKYMHFCNNERIFQHPLSLSYMMP